MSELFNDLPDTEKRRKGAVSQREAQRRKQIRRTAIVTFFAVMLLVMSIVVALPHVKSLLSIDAPAAEDYAGQGTGEVIVTIPEGSTGWDIASILVAHDVVASERAFVDAFEADKRASKIQAGSYRLKEQMSAVSAIAGLLDPNSRAEITVTIPEGFTVQQVSDRLVNVLGLDEAEVEAAFSDGEGIGLPAEANGNAEGWLAPVTYTFAPNTTAKRAISAMVKQRLSELRSSSIPQEQWARTLIVASIVEREVNWPDYYGQVARVIENRLVDQGQVGGKLQMDSTVLYGVGKTGGVPTREDLAADNPYNTYLHAGLPPTPISNPSIDVVKAAANPSQGDWLYFVTVNLNSGETKFANNLEDHNKNVEELRTWVAENPEPSATEEGGQ